MSRKLDIGNGGSPKPGPDWETSDIRPICDHHIPAWNVHMLGENEFECLLASMILEHVPRSLQKETLESWYLALAPGGTLEITVPNMKYIGVLLSGEVEDAIRLTFGEQDYLENTHCWGYTPTMLEKALKEVGFTVLELVDKPTLYAKVTK